MTDFDKSAAVLSPKKRALLELMLKENRAKGTQSFAIPKRKDPFRAPLTTSQRHLWFLAQMHPELPAYNVAFAYRVQGPLKCDVIQECLNQIIRRHEMLRTVFSAEEGGPQQVILQELVVPVLRRYCADDSEMMKCAQAFVLMPFDLEQGPLIRAQIFGTSPDLHLLVVAMHHLVTDGWSVAILFRELSELYNATVTSSSAKLETLTLQFGDFAEWQAATADSRDVRAQLAYWSKQVGRGDTVLQLGTDRPRPAVQRFRGDRFIADLGPGLRAQLKALADRLETSLFMVLLSAFQVFLYRHSGQAEILVGTPVNGRGKTELEPLIGYFVNMVVIRADFSQPISFDSVLKRTGAQVLEAHSHQDIPFERLVEELKIERSPSFSPLFQAAFALHQGVPGPTMSGLRLERVPLFNGSSKFDLSLEILDENACLTCIFEYDTDLFDREWAEEVSVHFRNLLRSIVDDPSRQVSALSLFGPEERDRLLHEWNRTEREYPRQRCIQTIVEQHAERAPEAPALRFPDAVLTYGELNRRANQLAQWLRGKGVERDAFVGVCANRSAAFVIGVLATLKAEAAYVPLDPSYPKERLAFMAEDTGARVLLTQDAAVDCLPEFNGTVFRLDRDWDRLSHLDGRNPPSSGNGQSTACVIYTSGSTGKPKGVLIPHRGISRLVLNAGFMELSPGDRVAQVSNLSFDASTFEIWSALLHGAELIGFDREVVLSPMDFGRAIVDSGITLLFLTTSLFNQVAREIPEAMSGLRYLFFGGEAANASCTRTILERGRPQHLLNAYGPAESTTYATCHEVDELPPNATVIPIGKPIANTTVYVLDNHREPAPLFVPGELYVGGDGVSPGYLNRPEATAERFLPDPFSSTSDARLYRTGDLVRRMRDGNLEFLGRADGQMKIRGFRVEPGEVEAVLVRQKHVAKAYVCARADREGNNKLVAYIVADTDSMPLQELREDVRRVLPTHMVPAVFVLVPDIPLSVNGKVNDKALPAPSFEDHSADRPYLVPHNEAEKILAGIWAELLDVKNVSVNDNFFELGGDSILSIQLISRATKAGLKITPKQVFRYQTIAELAQVAGATSETNPHSNRPDGDVPLTPIQHWYFERDWDDRNLFCQSIFCEVDQRLSDQVVEQAVRRTVAQHDSFRLRFTKDGTKWSQRYGEAAELAFRHYEIDSNDPLVARQDLAHIARSLDKSLDINNGPLFAFALIHLGSGARRLYLTAHHLVVDAVSWRTLLEDLNMAGERIARGDGPELQPPTASFKRWATRLTDWLSGEELRSQGRYWQEQLREPLASLRPDFTGENALSSTETIRLVFAERETERLKESSVGHRSSVAELLIAALVHSLGSELSSDFLVDMEAHGREDVFDGVDLSRTVGWFTCMYPVRFSPKQSSEEALREVKERTRSIPARGLGYGVLRYLCPEPELRGALRHAAAEIGFNFLGEFRVQTDAALFRLDQNEGPIGGTVCSSGTRPHKLDIEASITSRKLCCSFIFSRNLNRPERIGRLAQAFERSLQEIASHSEPVLTTADFHAARMGQEDFRNLFQRFSKPMPR